jgi:hypothetical protein
MTDDDVGWTDEGAGVEGEVEAANRPVFSVKKCANPEVVGWAMARSRQKRFRRITSFRSQPPHGGCYIPESVNPTIWPSGPLAFRLLASVIRPPSSGIGAGFSA